MKQKKSEQAIKQELFENEVKAPLARSRHYRHTYTSFQMFIIAVTLLGAGAAAIYQANLVTTLQASNQQLTNKYIQKTNHNPKYDAYLGIYEKHCSDGVTQTFNDIPLCPPPI
jgi:hypothetical protein